MSKNLIKLTELKEYETNPFMVDLKGKMYLQPKNNIVLAKGEKIIDVTTGEIKQDDTLIARRKYVDKSQFAKIYASEMAILFDLTKPALNVFNYLTKIMDYNNLAYFNYYKDYKKINYKSPDTGARGLRELATKQIIAGCNRPHHYWLNPTIVCKGERFAKYTEYIIDEKRAKEEEVLGTQMKYINAVKEGGLEDKHKFASRRPSEEEKDNSEHPNQIKLF